MNKKIKLCSDFKKDIQKFVVLSSESWGVGSIQTL